MLNQKPLTELVFIDIETTSQHPDFMGIPSAKIKELFYKKFEKEIEVEMLKATDPDVLSIPAVERIYNLKAPLLAEFGKVIAISIGVITEKEGVLKLSTLNMSNDDEKKLLEEFSIKVKTICLPKKLAEMKYSIVAYNGLVFDIPFLAKRFILNGMEIPVTLDIAGLKPWDIKWIIDPKDHWAMGSWNSHTSLDLLCSCFGVESSKDDMDGTQVKDAYWKDKALAKISQYCEKDIIALAKVYLKMQGNTKELIK